MKLLEQNFDPLTKAWFIHKLAKNKNPTNRSLFHTIQEILFELGEKLTNLTLQPEAIEFFVLFGKLSDSSGFYFWPIFESKFSLKGFVKKSVAVVWCV
jgi:hypothetical protein